MATVRKRSWSTKDGQTAWLVDYRDAAGKRRFQTFDSKREAQAALAEVSAEVQRGIHTPTRDPITVAAAAQLSMSVASAKAWSAVFVITATTLRNSLFLRWAGTSSPS